MGTRNRERRAAKQRKRQADGRRSYRRPAADPLTLEQAVVMTLFSAARVTALGADDAARSCAEELLAPDSGLPARCVRRAAASVLLDLVATVSRHGWQPVDLAQITRRRLSRHHVRLVLDLLAAEASSHGASTVDRRWSQQLAELEAAVWWPADADLLTAWGPRWGRGDVETVTTAVELMGLLATLPALPRVLPPPGTGRVEVGRGGGSVEDERALARVRSLLAKAESTEFPEEAEALSAKAQQLMARHSLGRLVAEAAADTHEPASARRIWLEAPYAGAKALLVQAVAEANRCRAVWVEALGFTTVVGGERDLRGTELLVTSLLVQATRALLDSGPSAAAARRGRTRSFRQSFLVAYATRIGERLRGASAGVVDDVIGTGDLLPVLVADAERVDRATKEMFPGVVNRGVAAGNPLGWAAGQAAADLALLDTHLAVTEAARVAS
jgi:hypothetical protein